MKRNFKIELLAPAKDKKCAFAAINCGADAIYIGAGDFGARKKACNTLTDIQDVVEYAHKFRVKVFVTINTLLFDNELPQAKKLIENLYKIGVDAIIIQDMGLLELNLPPIPLHSSTQCHNSTVEKVKFLEKTGFERAILARELSIDEIKNIAQNTEIELETFVQGALCVSYSGQCYLSYAIGGRSANRGECAQPCRKKYTLVDNTGKKLIKNQHLLCLKDFSASENLENLIDAGVSSFKIEGRLKDENYIKNTVSFYRQELDKIIVKKGLKRASYGDSQIEFEPNLNKTFNRGFCEYFLNGRKNNITSFETPKHRGELIGAISELKHDAFKLNSQLNKNDGISFYNKSNELCGTKIEKIENNWYFPTTTENLQVGTKIYRNTDYEFIKQIEKSNPTRKIKVNFNVMCEKDKISIEISDVENNIYKLKLKNNFDLAENEEKALENIKKQLSKLGDTEFIADNIFIKTTTIPFIKINEINDIRRSLIVKFREIRKKNYTIKKQTTINHPKYIENELNYKSNITNEKAKSFYEKCGAIINEYGLEHPTQKNLKNKQLMETKHCLKYALGYCSKTGQKLAEPLFLIDEKGQKYRLDFDCKNCRMRIVFP